MKLEKMNQVSATEFMSKSKEEMYDMAVEMVEKYNRLVDICNDSAERIADLVIERDNLVERHKVYTSALNKDLADKADKIELLEKEIEGRKEVYTALKKLMDTEYISIDDHNNIVNQFNKEIERLNRYGANVDKVNHDLVTKVTLLESELADCKVKIRHQRENLDGINKTLEIRTKEKERLIDVKNSQEKEIEAHEEENARLSEKIMELNGEVNKLNRFLKMQEDLTRDWKNKYVEAQKEIDEWESDTMVEELEKQVKYLEEELTRAWKNKYTGLNKEDDYGKSGFKRYIGHLIEEEERAVPERFKERLNKEITEIFTKEEETEVKGNGRTSSGRYPWGAKVNDIPCGEDSIE